MSHRVYLPLDLDRLARLVSDRSLPGPLTAHAVTDALIAAWPDGDQEGWEYAALAAAGDESLEGLAGTGAPRRRVVVAADVDAVTSRDGGPTAVTVAEVHWRQVAAGHVDVEALDAAITDGEDAPELAWFARQELADLG
ncbi:hypothetical protein NODU109028_13890 [Nocardioides dubius]|uniref:DUF6912 family protein n=1 Tax=Nocardioides dubius TaxID=317019 RepID=UPI0039E74B40